MTFGSSEALFTRARVQSLSIQTRSLHARIRAAFVYHFPTVRPGESSLALTRVGISAIHTAATANTRARGALIDVRRTLIAGKAGLTDASVHVDDVNARPVDARVRLALVDVDVTCSSSVASSTNTSVEIEIFNTLTVHTRIRAALKYF